MKIKTGTKQNTHYIRIGRLVIGTGPRNWSYVSSPSIWGLRLLWLTVAWKRS